MPRPKRSIFRIQIRIVAFCLSALLPFCLPNAQAQVVHAGAWTGYLDGTSVTNMVVRDSMLFVTTYRGTARVDPITRHYQYFRDMGVADLPDVLNLRYTAIDGQGRLWFLDQHKLMHLDPDLTLHIAGDEPAYQVNLLHFDHQDRLWAGFATSFVPPTTGEALGRFNGTTWDYIDVGVQSLNVLDIAFDPNDQPWFTTFVKIYRYNGSTYEVVQQDGTNVFGGSRIAISSDGRVAVAGNSNTTNLKYFNKTSWTTINSESFAFPVFDDDNVLWINDRFGHVYRMEPGDVAPRLTLTTAVNDRSGEQEYINGLGFDHEGALWMGKTIGLFAATDPLGDLWDFVPLTELQVPGPHPVIAATGDTAWLLTDAGVTLRVHDTFEKLDLPQQDISAIYYDGIRKGLWVGSPGTLGLYKGNTHELININPLLRDSVNNTGIYQIRGDKLGNIWIVVRDGLLRYDATGQWTSFYQGEELPHAPVGFSRMTFSYTDQSLWIRINGYSTKAFTEPPVLLKIAGDVVTDTHFDEDILTNYGYFGVVSDSVLWFSNTAEDALRYDHGHLTEYVVGPLNAEEWIIYNESTALLCSNLGLYVFTQEQWYKPVIPSDQIANNDALPACLTEDGHLYLANYPLLIVEDVNVLLEGLVTAVEPAESIDLTCYPNPVTSVLYFDPTFLSSCTDCTMVLISGSGQVIRKFASPLPAQLDLHDLVPGMYFLRIQSGSGFKAVLKLVKANDN